MIKKDSGFVLKKYNFRDTSVIASIYSLTCGKITVILKGFYTMKKEFSSPLTIGSLNEFVFYPRKREIWLVSFVDLVCDWPFLREDMFKARIAGVFVNIVNKTMQLWDVNPAVFYLLKQSMVSVQKQPAARVLYIFIIKFLAISGFRPQFNRCVLCQRQLKDTVYFSVSKGGFLCSRCSSHSRDVQRISKQTSSSLGYIQKHDFTVALRLNPSQRSESEILFLLRQFLLYHLDIDIFSPLPWKKQGISKIFPAVSKSTL